MNKKQSAAIYNFRDLRRVSGGYAGISFESVSNIIHHHKDFYELILITSGEWQHTINNTTSVLPAGTLLIFKPGVTHKLFTEPFKSTHFVVCIEQHYFEKYMNRVFPQFDLHTFSDYISKPISREKSKYIEHIGATICKNAKFIQAMADEIIYISISDFTYSSGALDCNTYVADIVQKLNNQLYMNTSVKDICSQYPYSHSMLLREFKKLTGMTVVEYKTQQKLKHACQLLSNTDAPIIEIASQLQYDSVSYFLQLFKKAYNMTPTEYRKKHQQIKKEGEDFTALT